MFDTATPVWPLVSGYASQLRAKKPLFFLQAFTDDSATDKGDKRLFLAGYLHRADVWAEFSDAWGAALRASPSIDYLKMVEANGLRGQFAGWSRKERDNKLNFLAYIIKIFNFFSFQTSISRLHNDRLLKPVSPRGIGNAHFTCNFSIVAGLARHVGSLGGDIGVKFIFDEQAGVDLDVAIFFDVMKSNLPETARSVISGTPVFENDKNVLPLQAADMLAWHIRREFEVGKSIENPLPMAHELRGSQHLVTHIDNRTIESWTEHHQQYPASLLLQNKIQWQNARKEFGLLQRQGFLSPETDPKKFEEFKKIMNALEEYGRRLKGNI